MKIMQIIRRFNFEEWGGTENVVWSCSRELIRLGDEVEILATKALGGAEREIIDGVPIRRFNYFYPYFPLSKAIRRTLDKKGGNPICLGMEKYLRDNDFDIIHTNNAGRLAELSARVSEKKSVPMVLSLHGGRFDVPEAEKRELMKPLRHTLRYGGAIERLLGLRRDDLACADGIICVGANEEAGLQARYPDKLVRFIPNGVDPEKFERPSQYDWRNHLGLHPREKLILNVSRIDYQKNQKQLVRLLARLRDRGDAAHLLMVGPVTSEWYGRELAELITELGLETKVTLVPGFPPEDDRLVAAYQQADVFIQPSLHEPFGIVALEAWCAGTPLLAARVGGLRYLVNDGKTGLMFDPGDDESLLAAYDRLPSVAERLREQARAEACAHYSWQAVTAKLRCFYEEVIETRLRRDADKEK
ncbi:MAG: glycosyltransferase family 4 protein [Victivallaceae bacterium]|nr:glycosyltransferase family 4 protein [Victivallaceae bacterium]